MSKEKISLAEHVDKEFKSIGWMDEEGNYKDKKQCQVCEQVKFLLSVFDAQSYSAIELPYALEMFHKLALFESLKETKGEE